MGSPRSSYYAIHRGGALREVLSPIASIKTWAVGMCSLRFRRLQSQLLVGCLRSSVLFPATDLNSDADWADWTKVLLVLHFPESQPDYVD